MMIQSTLVEPISLMDGFPIYQVYGLRIASDFPFANRLPAASGPPDLIFRRLDEAPFAPDWQEHDPAFVSPYRMADDQSLLTIHQTPHYDVLHFSGVVDFYCLPNQIAFHVLDASWGFLVEIHFLGRVLAYWLERMGKVMLHASAVSVDGRALAFLGSNHGGKSTLAASMMQLGYPFLTDDILALERTASGFVVHAGYPQMRVWAQDVHRFLADSPKTERVHPLLDKRRILVGADGFGQFSTKSQTIACFYLPQRRQSDDPDWSVNIERVRPNAAVVELLRQRFFLYWAGSKQEQAHRFQLLSTLAKQVVVKKLIYPSGHSYLPAVCQAILEDLN